MLTKGMLSPWRPMMSRPHKVYYRRFPQNCNRWWEILSRLRSPQVVCDKGFDAGLKMPFPATRGFFCGLLRPGGHFLGFFDHA
jgi:hypothetical protein